MPTTITLPSTFTPYTLDTYSIFSFDDACEVFIDDGKGYDDYEWTYRTKDYLNALAANAILLFSQNIIDDVILAIGGAGETFSPREYNFTTDSTDFRIAVDLNALNAYIDANREAYEKGKLRDSDGFFWFGNEEETRLAYYLDTVSASTYTSDEYIAEQYEDVPAYEFIDATLIPQA